MSNYKDRLVNEYNELQERYDKLYRSLSLHKEIFGCVNDDGVSDIDLVVEQLRVMKRYLEILELRCKYEGIEL